MISVARHADRPTQPRPTPLRRVASGRANRRRVAGGASRVPPGLRSHPRAGPRRRTILRRPAPADAARRVVDPTARSPQPAAASVGSRTSHRPHGLHPTVLAAAAALVRREAVISHECATMAYGVDVLHTPRVATVDDVRPTLLRCGRRRRHPRCLVGRGRGRAVVRRRDHELCSVGRGHRQIRRTRRNRRGRECADLGRRHARTTGRHDRATASLGRRDHRAAGPGHRGRRFRVAARSR